MEGYLNALHFLFQTPTSMNNTSAFLPMFFLFLLLLAYPLGFGKVLFGSVPYFGDVPLFDLNVLPFFAAALIFLRPGFLFGLVHEKTASRLVLMEKSL